MRNVAENISLHTGHLLFSRLAIQSTHKTLCPQGIRACVLRLSLQTTHISS